MHGPVADDDTRRDRAAERLSDYIKATVATAPPLTVEQRARLATLLNGGAADGTS